MKREHYLLIAGGIFLIFGFLFAGLGIYGIVKVNPVLNSDTQTLFSLYMATICTIMEIAGVASIAFGIKYTKKS